MSVVLDSSATIAWCFASETTAAIEALFVDVVARGAFAPALWPLEVANVLLVGVRKKRLSLDRRTELLRALVRLKVTIDHETTGRAWTDTILLADRHSLTVYDATYLELAIRLQLPLATLDQRLRSAAMVENVALEGV